MISSMKNRVFNHTKENEKRGKKKKAFTLVEILIVVAVIGILFVTLVPRIDFAGDKARETGVKTDFRSFELAAEQVLRENAGLADYSNVTALCGTNGINLYLDMDCIWINVKCDPNLTYMWRSSYKSVVPAYHMNKYHWNSIILDGTVPDDDIKV